MKKLGTLAHFFPKSNCDKSISYKLSPPKNKIDLAHPRKVMHVHD